jgi:hypothetical protein
MVQKELEFAVESYKILIGLPITARIRVQKQLCGFRDLIAEYTGQESEAVQNKYEHEVHMEQLADCGEA